MALFMRSVPQGQILATFLVNFIICFGSIVHPWAYGDSSVKGGGGRRVDLPEILHMIFFLLALPRFSPLFCPNLGGQLPPPPCPLPRTPMSTSINPIRLSDQKIILTGGK